MADVTDFITRLNAETLATAEAEDTISTETFTRERMQQLEVAGVTDNTVYGYYRRTGVEIHGIGTNDEIDSLDLFITDFDATRVDRFLGNRDVTTLVNRASRFVDRCRGGLADELDDSSEVFDMCQEITKRLDSGPTLRVFVLTNAQVTPATARTVAARRPDIGGVAASVELWDATRWHRLDSSGTQAEPITVQFDPPLPCLSASDDQLDYHVVLAVIPGQKLADLYSEYGTRLLELNVRSFLQAKGAVNRGIRDTIIREPGRFLAYNNGITATASQVTYAPGGAIEQLHDLQIVNGGQTTASLYHTSTRDHADLTGIQVQAKINIIAPDRLADIVPRISQYSNTQNRVSTVDLRANDAFHVEVEKITRTLWAPATTESGGQNTIWFYERARGQYNDALTRERTPARQKKFKVLHPLRQKFTKTDLAKYANSWARLPHTVSLGAEKNFNAFMSRVKDSMITVDQKWCQDLISTAIIFKETERLVSAHNFGGYRANIVTYTVAKLSDATDCRVDLDRIWQAQKLTPDVAAAIDSLAPLIFDVVIDPPAGITNIGEWCKREACWDRVQQVDWTADIKLTSKSRAQRAATADMSEDEQIAKVMTVSAEEWHSVRDWAMLTHNLQFWQRSIADTLGEYATIGRRPSPKQAKHGLRILQEAMTAGYVRTDQA